MIKSIGRKDVIPYLPIGPFLGQFSLFGGFHIVWLHENTNGFEPRCPMVGKR